MVFKESGVPLILLHLLVRPSVVANYRCPNIMLVVQGCPELEVQTLHPLLNGIIPTSSLAQSRLLRGSRE